MKKLYIVLLALVVGVFFASTALAFHEGSEGTAEGALGVSGTYYFDAESTDGNDGSERRGYDDDLEIVLRLNKGTVTGVIDFEISDDGTWDGSNISRGTNLNASNDYVVMGTPGGNAIVTDTNTVTKLIDNYWIEWAAMDDLTVKIGEYSNSFGRAVLIYADPPAHVIGFKYSGLDAAALGLYLGKIDEGSTTNTDDDVDSITLTANFKIEALSKANFIYITADADGDTSTYIGADLGLTAGPVALGFEYGAVTSDTFAVDGGNFMVAEVGLDELIGFDLNINYFSSNEDFNVDGFGWGHRDFYPYKITGWTDVNGPDDLTDMTLIGLSASYGLNDKATLSGKILASGESRDMALGTEVDVRLTYKFDDNVTGYFDVATLSPDSEYYGPFDDSVTDMRARLLFKF
jgi:hypothetical protein